MLHPGICIQLTSQNMQNTAVKLHQDNTSLQFTPPYIPFYIVNWRLQGYTLFSLFLFLKIDCGYSLERFERLPSIYVLSKIKKKNNLKK